MGIVGARIKQRRAMLRISQDDLCLAVGTSQKQISRYESGTNDPTGDVLIRLAQALHTSTDWLLGLTDIVHPLDYLEPREEQVISLWRDGDIGEAIKVMVRG